VLGLKHCLVVALRPKVSIRKGVRVVDDDDEGLLKYSKIAP